jgi:hypothetical protein
MNEYTEGENKKLWMKNRKSKYFLSSIFKKNSKKKLFYIQLFIKEQIVLVFLY